MRSPKKFGKILIAVLVLATVADAQKSGGSGSSSSSKGSGASTTNPQPQRQMQQMLVLYGQVQLDDGTSPPEGTAIRRSCMGSTSRREAYTDSKGYFTLTLGAQMQTTIPDASDQAGAPGPFADPYAGLPGIPTQNSSLPSSSNPQSAQAQLWNCELTAEYPGFRSDRVSLAGVHAFDQQTHVKTIVLHRTEKAGSALVSVTSLKAPNDAKKHFDKGQEALTKGALSDSAEHLEKAVKIYPEYAVAWTTLGEVYERQNRLDDARAAYEKATAADSKFSTPYLRMANVAAIQHRWQDVSDITERALGLDSGSVPQALYLHSVAQFNLGHLDVAEKNALKAQQLDPQHRIARLELLMGYIEARKGNYSAAAERVRSFLKAEPESPDSAEVQKQLLAYEKAGGIAPANTAVAAPSATPRPEQPKH